MYMYDPLKFTSICCSLLGVLAKWRKATIYFVTSVFPSLRSHGTNRLSMDGFSQNFTFELFRKYMEKNSSYIETLHEDQQAYWIISHSVLRRMRNVSDENYRENQNTFVFNNLFFENRVVYDIMWKNFVEPDRPQLAVWSMCIACWIPKATNTHSGYVILIACRLQQLLKQLASMYFACLVCKTCQSP